MSSLEQKFVDTYPRLGSLEQSILQCLSIQMTYLSQTKLLRSLVSAKICNNDGKTIGGRDIQEALWGLADAGFVVVDENDSMCEPELRGLASEYAMEDGSFYSLVTSVLSNAPTATDWDNRPHYREYGYLLRDLRIAVYLRDEADTIEQLLDHAAQHFTDSFYEAHPFEILFLDQAGLKLFQSLAAELKSLFLVSYLDAAFVKLRSVSHGLEIAESLCEETEFLHTALPYSILLHRICRGSFVEARHVLKGLPDSVERFSYLGWLELLEGNYQQSLKSYRDGLALMGKTTRKRKLAYTNYAGAFYAVALLQSGEEKNIQEAITFIQIAQKAKTTISKTLCPDIHQALVFHLGLESRARAMSHSLAVYKPQGTTDPLSLLLAFLTEYWQEKMPSANSLPQLEWLAETGNNNGFFFIAREAFGLLSSSPFSAKEDQVGYDNLQRDVSHPPLFSSIQAQPKWQKALTALNSLGTAIATKSQSEKAQERLVWQIKSHDYWSLEIVPKLQKLGKNGNWTKGRTVGLSTLYSTPGKIPCLTDHDLRVVATLQQGSTAYYQHGETPSYSFNDSKAFAALIGHPHIYVDGNFELPIELKGGSPELHVKRLVDGFALYLKPYMEDGEAYRLEQVTPTRWNYIAATDDYKKIRDIVGASITVPLAKQQEVVQTLGNIAGLVTIHSDITAERSKLGDANQASAQAYIHLFPSGDGLCANIVCKPIKEGGQYYRPGQGGNTVLSEIGGVQVQVSRDLSLEVHNALAVVEKCTILQNYTPVEREWFIPKPQDCLELLTELQAMGDGVVVEWPKKESLKIAAQVSTQSMSLQVKKKREWFEVRGSLVVDNDLIISMKDLLELCHKSDSRFIALNDGRFLALSERFKQQLDEMNAYSQPSKDGAVLHPLTRFVVADFIDEVEKCQADKEWVEGLEKFRNPLPIELPSTLRAELREYQRQGFEWLARLSSWEIGACLADDMGLGKTVQALAALLMRAAQGPSLVVAPTSVTMNWIDEARRFAPTLKVKRFVEGDRQEILDNIGAFDLLICSYGLLHSESDKLSVVNWQTAILDEAQAIKNKHTKRSQAAVKLQAKFKLITTGTPIENNVGELWSLFQFINPGLLGSYDKFCKKYATPIEKGTDRGAAARLKKLIQPFILRRLKGDVVQELPSRTEVNIQVEMGEEERALYEAQRQNAVEQITLANKGADQHYFQVLTEITRLRRLCCNPKLIVPEAGVNSAKLDVFTELVQELVENKHKALVFSQFVGHLGLIKERLDRLGISYQYLDGSTSVAQRAARVRAFQAGKGDIFLISLKAGGSGLNLTAADYVIHMDPWWNPAVEDQASDRSHRIGQQRPVTIYRLIVKDSIEEKIVALHREKRDLADTLLAGSDVSGSISASQLLALLKEK